MMKTRHKGKILGIGSCIGIIAPATACADFDYTPGIELLHQWGYKTKISKTLKTNEGYLAGSDKLRASELNKFFADDEVDAILCFGGGYGCTRILDLLDYDLIRKHPKLFILPLDKIADLLLFMDLCSKLYHENLRNIRFLLFVVVFACLFHSVLFRYLKNMI